jgi:RNA polymerase sigma factor (sigma-70 family)
VKLNAITGLLVAAGRVEARDLDDNALLARFTDTGDVVAFEVLVWRHGGMVRGVCRRYLTDPNDVDDVTQVAFLALARRARSVRSVGPWLARVAVRAARRLHRANAARGARHVPVGPDVSGREPALDDGWRGVLAEEVARLPDCYRMVVRRCYLDGLTASEAAREFGWPRGTVLTRLAWAKTRLRQRLTSRGVVLGAGGVAGLLFQLAAGPVTRAAARDILRAAVGAPGARVAQLTDGVLTAMFWTKVKFVTGVALMCGATLVCAASKPEVSVGQGTVAVAPPPRAVAEIKTAATSEKSPKEAAPSRPAKTKPGVGPGFGTGAGEGAAPAPAPTPTPAKVKPGVGPGFGTGVGPGKPAP